MSPLDKKVSPFSEKGLSSRKEKAFKAVSFLAAFSVLSTLIGLYVCFFKTPAMQAVYYLAQTEQNLQKTSLINPQPPQEKSLSSAKALPEETDKNLIQQLEKEKDSIDQKAETLREIIQQTSNVSEKPQKKVLPESPELQKLQQEKDNEALKKIQEIDNLHKERLEAEKQKADTKKEKEKEKKQPVLKKEKINEIDKDSYLFQQKTKLPQPDLIQTNLKASLPDFSLIKKAPSANVIPLHIIDPLPELQEKSRYGKLPVESKGRTPFSAYRKQIELPPTGPYVAILFSGLGKRENATQAAIASLPDVVSLSFSPYTEKLKTFISDARKVGHETLIDLPMQQGTFPETDPGPFGLVSGLPEQENRKRLHKVLGQDVAFIGVSAAANETFSYSETQMQSFFNDITQRGLIYIEGTDIPQTPSFKNALRPDVYISKEFHRAAIRHRLEQARKIALEKGSAFVRIETVPVTLVSAIEWMKSFTPTEEKPVAELTFVPLSYYVSAQREKK